jgi:hypothetical protein
MPPVTDTESEVDSGHVAAAQSFFSSEPPASKAEAPKGGAPAPETKVTTPPASPLGSFIKQPAAGETKPAPAAPTEVEDPLTKIADPDPKSKHAEDVKALKKAAIERGQKLSAAEKELADLRAKVDAATKQAPVDDATKARIAELETANKTYSERLRILDVKSHPDFQKQFVVPRDTAISTLKKIVTDEEVLDVNIDQLLSLRGKKLNEAVSSVLEKLTPFSQGAFSAEVRKVLGLEEAAAQTLAQSEEFLKQHQTQSLSRNRAAFDRVSKEFNGFFVPQVVDPKATPEQKVEAEKYNAAIADTAKLAEQLAFGTVDDTTAARMAHESANFRFLTVHALPKLGGMIVERDARIAELESQLASVTVSKPRVDGGAGAPPPETPGEVEADHTTAARKYF